MGQVINLFTRQTIRDTKQPSWPLRDAYLSNPSDPAVVIDYADGLAEAGHWTTARVMYAKASRLKPDDWRPVYNEGCCLIQQHEWLAAMICFGRALSLTHEANEQRDIVHNIECTAKRLFQ